MRLRFPYLSELIQGPTPPSLPTSARERWRPLVPITVYGPLGAFVPYTRALMDPGADDTIFPIALAIALGIPLLPATGHAMRWRGQPFALRFGVVEMELTDAVGASLRWPATVAFTAANIRYPLLGICGCLNFLDVKYLGRGQELEIEANTSFPDVI